jgi:CPA1 family monovalent cation:H+ antiporter
MLEAARAQLASGSSPATDLVRHDLEIRLGPQQRSEGAPGSFGSEYDTAYRAALRAARQVLLAMRDSGEIGDDAFHKLENDLDWMEVSDPLRAANADAIE